MPGRELRRLLALLAGHSGGLLVLASLATASGIPRTTLNRYLELLSMVFLIKQVPAWSTERAALRPYRTKDKVEVDAIPETPDGRVIAIEVKTGATIPNEDLAGQQTLPFGDRLRAVPIDALWQNSS